MTKPAFHSFELSQRVPAALVAGVLVSALWGCGGGSDVGMEPMAASVASATTSFSVEVPTLPQSDAMFTVRPLFQVASMQPGEPDDTDADNSSASANMAPKMLALGSGGSGGSSPMEQAKAAFSATYSPAQIRAAYGFPALPASLSGLSPAQAAQLGAGQTIYIVDAMHNPNAAVELAAFNAKFGLPQCATASIPVNAPLPLAAASTSGCTFSVVYNTANATMTSTAPAYEAGWATEISLDVQWAHASAPLARIVLIEAASASGNDLMGAIQLANRMGPGAVSMSFGGLEGSWTSTVDSIFTGANMTYLAATGDDGAAVSWPAVSTRVLAVGGTSLTYTGTGKRSEVTWSGTGGGTSIYTRAPSYQTSAVPGMGTTAFRRVSDVSFNADPNTGQYVAIIAPGTTTPKWISVGGTSLSTPQWAGLVAIGNATRALSGKGALGTPHSVLYGQVAAVPGAYASAFADITTGSDGTCVTCYAKVGFDNPTGLGTPNVSNLVSLLSGAAAPSVAPVVTPANITGVVGTALSFTVSATAPNAMTYTLANAPNGLAIGATGVVTWTSPVAGTYAVTVTAKDSKTGLTGSGVYTIAVTSPKAPVGTNATINGTVGKALSFAATFTSSNPLTYTIAGAPSGMAISATGAVTWASPVLGTYTVTVTAKDSKTGLSGTATYTVKITSGTTTTPTGLTITAPAMVGKVGTALSGTIAISAPGATQFSVQLSGMPLGMGFSMTGTTLTARWASPLQGNYSMTVKVADNLGRTATVSIPITIAAK
jgi:hypothetical protein